MMAKAGLLGSGRIIADRSPWLRGSLAHRCERGAFDLVDPSKIELELGL